MIRRLSLLAVVAFALVACADDDLPDAIYDNTVETFTIGSLLDTPVAVPSAFSIPENRVVRTDQSPGFDFAYVQVGSRHLLVPLDALGLGSRTTNPGLLHSGLSFDLLVDPPSDGYITTDSVAIAVGDVVLARSRVACYLGVPQYAKLLVKAIDDVAKTVTFDAVANINCGYRSLALGLPRT